VRGSEECMGIVSGEKENYVKRGEGQGKCNVAL